jgi:choline dehydrogenase-like flavoprotein
VNVNTGIAIVGSGPGGATVARELARTGARVTLLERGRDWRSHPLYGTYPGVLLYADRRALLFTREGMNVIRPLMLGGATSMYCACSSPPRPWWRERYRIDLDEYAEDAARELRVAPLAPELRGVASTRIAEAGLQLGMPWHPQDKFMQPFRHGRFDCGAHCMLGCRCRAKWNAAEYVDDAVAAGCELITGARVDRVRIEDGHARGVVGRIGGRELRVDADRVVIAAGGLGTPVILRNSGFERAGEGITMDTTAMVYGLAKGPGMGNDPPMTWSCPDDENSVLFSTLIDPWLMYPLILATKGPAYPMTWHRWGRTFGVMIKLKDEVSGRIEPSGRISKGSTDTDARRLQRAEQTAGRILREAGCAPDTIFTTPLRGTHPSSTVRIGTMLSHNLETEVSNLYVCDASVFPEALGRPTVLTIIALARRLSDHLLGVPARFAATRKS